MRAMRCSRLTNTIAPMAPSQSRAYKASALVTQHGDYSITTLHGDRIAVEFTPKVSDRDVFNGRLWPLATCARQRFDEALNWNSEGWVRQRRPSAAGGALRPRTPVSAAIVRI